MIGKAKPPVASNWNHILVQSLALKQQDQRSGWKFLGIFALVFVAGWIAGIIAGLVARRIGLGLHLSDPVGHTLSLLSIFTARFILWVPATHIVLKRRLRDLTFPLKTGWWFDLLCGQPEHRTTIE